jgi:predicted RNase H-like nuclease (RuvC/YqgF family)
MSAMTVEIETIIADSIYRPIQKKKKKGIQIPTNAAEVAAETRQEGTLPVASFVQIQMEQLENMIWAARFQVKKTWRKWQRKLQQKAIPNQQNGFLATRAHW